MNSKNLKALSVAIATICMSFFIYSCKEEDESRNWTAHDPSQPVVVTSFKPDSGRIAETVLLNGSNFGYDTSNLRVYFNDKQATIINSSGSRILALVPRLPGDTCVVSGEAGGKRATYTELFRYKIDATVSTLLGNGDGADNPIIGPTLGDSQFRTLYLGIDKEDNLYASMDGDFLAMINERENSVRALASAAEGMSSQFQVTVDPTTGMIMMGSSGARDRFFFCDPRDGWAPRNKFIKEWHANGFQIPDNTGKTFNNAGGGGYEIYSTHLHCLYNPADKHYYTRYSEGQVVKINPDTWEATIIYMTPMAGVFGMAFHPLNPNELWMAYCGHTPAGRGQGYHALFTLNVADTTYKRVGGGGDGGTLSGFRDGKLNQALFGSMRQINFDADGFLYIGDAGNHCIRRVDTKNMTVETVVGIPGKPGDANGKREYATFNSPHGLVVNSEGIVYIGDHMNSKIRRIAIE